MRKYRIIPEPNGKWSIEVQHFASSSWMTIHDPNGIIFHSTSLASRHPLYFKTKYDAKCWIDADIRDQKHLSTPPEIYP